MANVLQIKHTHTHTHILSKNRPRVQFRFIIFVQCFFQLNGLSTLSALIVIPNRNVWLALPGCYSSNRTNAAKSCRKSLVYHATEPCCSLSCRCKIFPVFLNDGDILWLQRCTSLLCVDSMLVNEICRIHQQNNNPHDKLTP